MSSRNTIPEADQRWLKKKLASWGISDVLRLLSIFDARLVLVEKKKSLKIAKKNDRGNRER